jgi:hypothetical protein
MTYAFIDCALAANNRSPMFDIPRLCFVEAGLALGYANASGGGGLSYPRFLQVQLRPSEPTPARSGLVRNSETSEWAMLLL